jgi:hypothetical protein
VSAYSVVFRWKPTGHDHVGTTPLERLPGTANVKLPSVPRVSG